MRKAAVKPVEKPARKAAQRTGKKVAGKPAKKPAKKPARRAAALATELSAEAEELRIVFVPALVALLTRAEHLKGEPLTRAEVLAIRDEAQCIALPASVAAAAEESRGYPDLDPEQAWEQWRAVRGSILAAGRVR